MTSGLGLLVLVSLSEHLLSWSASPPPSVFRPPPVESAFVSGLVGERAQKGRDFKSPRMVGKPKTALTEMLPQINLF